MYYIVKSDKSFEQAVTDLESKVVEFSFSVLHIHNIGQTLRSKNIDFKENCAVFEVCNPKQAEKVLAIDINLNMALPCRISVFSENSVTKIGFIRPAQMLMGLSEDATLIRIANEVETTMTQIVDNAK